MRTVVSVATDQFVANQDRLHKALNATECRFYRGCLPPSSPTHEQCPWGFKVYALLETHGDAMLWCDSSIVPLRPLTRLWNLIETQGYWFSENLPPGEYGAPYNCGQFTCDSALPLLGITREEAFGIPQVIATAFGLDMRHQIARDFLAEWKRLAENGSFRGPRNNFQGESGMLAGVPDRRVEGHRHDQTAASVIAHRLGMKLTRPPDWIVDRHEPTPNSILAIHRFNFPPPPKEVK
jgi:hypothetical protein